jgi:hypothetical protein
MPSPQPISPYPCEHVHLEQSCSRRYLLGTPVQPPTKAEVLSCSRPASTPVHSTSMESSLSWKPVVMSRVNMTGCVYYYFGDSNLGSDLLCGLSISLCTPSSHNDYIVLSQRAATATHGPIKTTTPTCKSSQDANPSPRSSLRRYFAETPKLPFSSTAHFSVLHEISTRVIFLNSDS